MSTQVSSCCEYYTEVIRREPNDIEYRHMSEIATICLKCREDCSTIDACDQCGDPGNLERIGGDDCCPKCAAEMRKLNPGMVVSA